ncbi:hypothetical protein N8T08_004726 [Aspergillus melleus]|uniref:Uncharacterized protein n=1 Tax=Aspergillus melleus TaxID=138277 RepID=A0ACC3B3N9_9EURO|nr:hypothetical protein N8T08_004726 [Aspergillus melleus]
MKAIVVEEYGAIDALKAKEVPDPGEPKGRDLSAVRAGKYDDYLDYYDKVPCPYQILGYDGAGTVLKAGPESTIFRPGDEVFYSGSPIRQGSNAELQPG